ncbi:MAG: 4-hydroxyphenylpyruvate dioxygenase [Ignavibacteriaceae bacterium]|nr:4-hydroxyphenylpyruvate dioxygenase [Ignavibacteriaceae bacterium]NUM69876.1 4-hydroxyphenylpyruvate dioxygenase [Ignavibacteriaceae bacterium]
MANKLGIRGYDYLEFYVGTAKVWAYWFQKALNLKVVAYSGPETGVKDKVSYLLEKNNLKILVSSPVKPSNYELYNFIVSHGDGVKRWSLNVNDVEQAYKHAITHGAVPAGGIRELKDSNGIVYEASIKLYDDAEITFVNRDDYKGLFRPGFDLPRLDMNIETADSGLQIVDHIVGNVRENEMNFWVDYMNAALNFETFIDFGPGDIGTKYSALLSKVVRSEDSIIRNPVNEPYQAERKSQIQEYIEEFCGTGIQHVALRTDNIIETIANLRRNGVEFLDVPDTYYDLMKERNLQISEDLDELKEHRILVDHEGDGYLLQIFTKPVGDRPTFFFEVIQRRGESHGFGKGNFQALFESIEREQAARGNL